MINNADREMWYRLYLTLALRCDPPMGHEARLRNWAWSMALIAEQFMDKPEDDA